jgi:erythromycin esterase-like protein
MLQNSPFYSTVRDIQMAKNFQYLSDSLFKNQKIIVWTHTGHFIDLQETHIEGNYQKNMGQYLFDSPMLRANSYLIVFSSRKGEYGVIRSEINPVMQCKYESLEDYVPKRIEFGFLNFTNYNLNSSNQHSYLSQVLGHQCNYKDWRMAYDGLIYIKKMHPCSTNK